MEQITAIITPFSVSIPKKLGIAKRVIENRISNSRKYRRSLLSTHYEQQVTRSFYVKQIPLAVYFHRGQADEKLLHAVYSTVDFDFEYLLNPFLINIKDFRKNYGKEWDPSEHGFHSNLGNNIELTKNSLTVMNKYEEYSIHIDPNKINIPKRLFSILQTANTPKKIGEEINTWHYELWHTAYLAMDELDS
jgi:hypothetical protein